MIEVYYRVFFRKDSRCSLAYIYEEGSSNLVCSLSSGELVVPFSILLGSVFRLGLYHTCSIGALDCILQGTGERLLCRQVMVRNSFLMLWLR